MVCRPREYWEKAIVHAEMKLSALIRERERLEHRLRALLKSSRPMNEIGKDVRWIKARLEKINEQISEYTLKIIDFKKKLRVSK
jgi:hypothetical protein